MDAGPDTRRAPWRLAALLGMLLLPVACADQAPLAPAGPELTEGGFPPWVGMESDVTSLIEDVWGSDPDHVFTVGLSGTIQHYDGSTWTRQSTGTTSSLRAVWGSGADDVWAVGGLGALLHYDGTGWTLVDRLRTHAGTRYQLYGVWGSGPDHVWAVGNTGTSHVHDGDEWSYYRVPTSEVLRGVWGTGPDNVIAVGGGGVIFRHDGDSWSGMESPTTTRLNDVHGRSATDIFAAGSFGVILHYDGERWAEDAQSREITRAHIRDLFSDGRGNIFAVAWGGTILRHDGKRWHLMESGTGTNLEGGWGSGNGRLIAGGSRGLVLQGGTGIGFGHRPPGLEPEPIWPLAGTPEADADSVHSPFGPRALPGGYDFHAGIDLPAPRGTPVRTVLAGEVIDVAPWNGSSSAGNRVNVRHESGHVTAYLHLDSITVTEGQWLERGDQLGTVGSTGATYNHLHLGYFRTINFTSIDERQS
ncbi:MAG TPA: M23 family metallopeptidase, partial [Longimicrobiales bacterium]|nr:M23 family metallopeptidase [Longimicrobiales bacterium]